MSSNAVCSLCLAMNAPMHDIVGSPLQGVYEKLTDVSLKGVEWRVLACYLCYSQLRKCHDLMVKSSKAIESLKQLLLSIDVGNLEFINKKNREIRKQNELIITPVELVATTGPGRSVIDGNIKVDKSNTNRQIHYLMFEEDLDRVVRQDVEIIENNGYMDRDEVNKQFEDASPINQENPEETKTYVRRSIGYLQFENSEGNNEINESENMEAGAAPAEKYKESHAENTQDERIPISGGKNILEESKIYTVVVEKEATGNIGSFGLQSTKTASNRQVSTNWYFDNAINQGNVTIANDNDCTSTNTDIRVTSNQQLRETFVCDYCGNVFNDEHLLIEHTQQHHITGRKTSCGESSQQRNISREQRFISRTGVLNKHTETHSGKKRFECEICKVRFTYKSTLTVHSRVHTGEKPYECDLCKVSFNQKSNLTTHLRVHTSEKPYECGICKVRFTQKSTLTIHSRTHTGEKPYECDICKNRFSEKGSLRRHARIHTGERL